MNKRFVSLDVFRGLTMAAMILVNNPGNENFVFKQLDHSIWNGCTFTDLVFPFFLFAVGNAMAFSLDRVERQGGTIFWEKIIKRTLLIYIIGLILNWIPFFSYNNVQGLIPIPLKNYRIFGVLQRISLCYFFTAVLIHFNKKTSNLIFVTVLLLLGYWLICVFMNPEDPYSLNGWFGTNIDMAIVGKSHLYMGEGRPFDPEGLMSLPAAIAQTLIGYLIGRFIQMRGKEMAICKWLLVIALVLLFLGYLWGYYFPINKKIWTSSYALFTSGWAVLILSILFYLIEFKNCSCLLFKSFEAIGKNALFMYMISTIVPKILFIIHLSNHAKMSGKSNFNLWEWIYANYFSNLFIDQRINSMTLGLTFLLFCCCIAVYLNSKKILIKI